MDTAVPDIQFPIDEEDEDSGALDTLGPLPAENKDRIDKYIEGIELSNACRSFYVNRLNAASAMKKTFALSSCQRSEVDEKPGNEKIHSAMASLRRHMASLMDQDLALMKHLLTLNEQIEDMKWHRKLGSYAHAPSGSSSQLLPGSSRSYSSFAASELRLKYPSPSELSLLESTEFTSMLFVDSKPSELDIAPSSHPKLTRSTSDLGSSGDDGSIEAMNHHSRPCKTMTSINSNKQTLSGHNVASLNQTVVHGSHPD